MTKLTHIMKDSDLQKLENLKNELKPNDYKIAGKLYASLRSVCLSKKISMKLDKKGRILKVNVLIDDQYVLAKPVLQMNQLTFFYKKKYYNAEEILNCKLNTW